MERTKSAIVEAFRQELEETPISKITVKKIVERCQINRNTFYYYFDGIPSLVDYHLKSLADQLIDSYRKPDAACEMQKTVQYFKLKKKSVLNTYQYLPREDFLRFLNKITAYIIEKHLRRVVEDTGICEEDFTILLLYYKGALVGALLDWLDAGMSYDMERMVIRLFELMKGNTRQAIIRAVETRSEDGSCKSRPSC